MKVRFLIKIPLFAFFVALFAAILLAWGGSPSVAAAETYSVDDNHITVYLDYGAAPTYPVFAYGENKFFKITSYFAKRQNGSTFSLVEDGRVTAPPLTLPLTYQMSAEENTHLSDAEGNLLDGDDFEGTINVVVRKNDLPITLSAASLSKTYGDAAPVISWDFREESDRDATIEITFSSDGFSADAPVGSYLVSAAGVFKGGVDCSDLYQVKLFSEQGVQSVDFSVEPKEIVFSLAEKPSVPFNDFLLADGASVCSLTKDGALEERVTVFFRLVSPPENILVVGESYLIEPYAYRVQAATENEEYALTDPSNYHLTFDGEQSVVASQGALTIYQDAALLPSRQGDATYLYAPFVYAYLDPVIENYRGELLLTVSYFDRSLTVRCEADAPYGALACGSYPLTLNSFGSEGDCLSDLAFEGTVLLVVEKRVLVYEGEDSAEVCSGDSFVKNVSLSFHGAEYAFSLTANVAGAAVGDEVPYQSFSSVNPNFSLDYSAAKVTMRKRTTGVSVVSKGTDKAFYGDDYTLAAPYLDFGSPGATLLPGEIAYSYTAAGSAAVREGLPREVGSYSVRCSYRSDNYEAEDLLLSFTVEKRPVAAHYLLTTARKTYGESFSFDDSTVQVDYLYDYDESSKTVDRSSFVRIEKNDGTISGVFLRSAGAAAEKKAGEYSFDFSGMTSQKYKIAAAIFFDRETGTEVTKFVVEKAERPAPPTVSVEQNGRTISVSASGSIKAELSVSFDFSSVTTLSSETGTVSFSSLLYGETYYVRVRAEAGGNYRQASDWSQATSTIPFASPSVSVSKLGSTEVTFTADMKNTVSGYVIEHRVGTGEWREGLTIEGLSPDTHYSLYFRAKKGNMKGAIASVSLHTLLSPVAEDAVVLDLDREAGVLEVTSSAKRLEYRLLSSTGEPLTEDWTDEPVFDMLEKDTTYVLQVRVAAAEGGVPSEIREIRVDTHKAKTPFSLKRFLSNWFLFFVGGGILLLAILFLVLFIRAKKKADREELGG